MKQMLVSILVWLCLCFWLAAAIAAGVSAAGVFAVLPDLEPTLTPYAALPVEVQGRIAAGLITEPIFTATDLLQGACSILLVLGVVLHEILRMGSHRPLARWVWAGAIAVASILLWGRMLLLMPTMNGELRQYRATAMEGNLDATIKAREAFDALHPTASTMMETCVACLVLAIVAGAVLATPRRKKALQ
jgi:hypothetical protein